MELTKRPFTFVEQKIEQEPEIKEKEIKTEEKKEIAKIKKEEHLKKE
jgi:hypothetical protein